MRREFLLRIHLLSDGVGGWPLPASWHGVRYDTAALLGNSTTITHCACGKITTIHFHHKNSVVASQVDHLVFIWQPSEGQWSELEHRGTRVQLLCISSESTGTSIRHNYNSNTFLSLKSKIQTSHHNPFSETSNCFSLQPGLQLQERAYQHQILTPPWRTP